MSSAARSQTGLDVRADIGILRRDQDEPVPEQVRARVGLDQSLLLAVIHPIEIGRDEHVGRRALLDLLDQRVAGRVGNRHLLAALALPLRGGLVERVLQACGREHEHVPALGGSGRGSRSQGQNRGGQQSQPRTP